MIFLDAAATTPVRREAIEAMWPYLTGQFGNPSSHHGLGETAAAALADAREEVASLLGCLPGEVIFTAGGTEADNLAVKGIALARHAAEPARRRVLISAVEHPAVQESAAYLQRCHGFSVEVVPVDADGRVDPAVFASLLGGGDGATGVRGVHSHNTGIDVALASVMYANNEIGTVQPIAELAAVARAAEVPFHTDAVQAAGWLPIKPGLLGVDALSMSGHKLGAPKGSGVLYLRGRVHAEPLLHGGGQERGARSGTENVAFAVAFAAALRLAEAERPAAAARVAALREAFIAGILHRISGSVLTGHRTERLPSVASFCFPGTSGESVLLELERRSILCSSGSACAAGSDEPSAVLTALGIRSEVAQTAVRFSFSSAITEAELRTAGDAVVGALETIGRLQPGSR
ncbi:cysteine desulfurase family protein [Paenarthrobacter sp. PH39-S1]|uniref:cysteine desulfurase family protein n=1 Tax=Paenarthrobacter sp. PH39-S1 TaxID=3046204 RepID=UPI0024BBCA2F|nr:cysteine desulfurase family protein [Paenarthrobacter sp. PH39-S1]MDJ0356509.1 cysteine desulfurase family protein [Paenarthrobacter sp. PH39-S1]